MRHLTTVALMLNLGIASLYAQQPAEEHSGASRVRMTFSGSTMSTTLAIAPDTLNHESHVAGNSSLGPFTYRGLWADAPGSGSTGSCGSGFGRTVPVVAGGGVFRFATKSLGGPAHGGNSVCGYLGSRASGGSPVRDLSDHRRNRPFQACRRELRRNGRRLHPSIDGHPGAGVARLLRPSSSCLRVNSREPCPISAMATSCHSTSEGTENDSGHWWRVCRTSTGRAHRVACDPLGTHVKHVAHQREALCCRLT